MVTWHAGRRCGLLEGPVFGALHGPPSEAVLGVCRRAALAPAFAGIAVTAAFPPRPFAGVCDV